MASTREATGRAKCMALTVTVSKDETIHATTLRGRVVVPNAARQVWCLDDVHWDATAWLMGDDVLNVRVKAGPHSIVQLEFYLEPVKHAPSPDLRAEAVLVFTSDIPEFDGNIMTRIKATSGTLTVAALGTNRFRGHNAASFVLGFPGYPELTGTYLVKRLAGKDAI